MRALLQRWAFAWRMAYSCLCIQLSAYQEMKAYMPMYLPDDATEDELAEMATEQRRCDKIFYRSDKELLTLQDLASLDTF
jgi:hypothetical protein